MKKSDVRSFSIQARVSKGVSPLLHAHLEALKLSGESPGKIARNLAEEALQFRRIITALQHVDLNRDFPNVFHTTTNAGMEHITKTIHTGKPPVKQESVTETVVKATPDGSKSMASMLVQRDSVGGLSRR